MSEVCEIINPWTAEAEMAVPYDSAEAVDAKIAQAQSTFLSWRDRPLADRVAVVERFVALALASKERVLAHRETAEPFPASLRASVS